MTGVDPFSYDVVVGALVSAESPPTLAGLEAALLRVGRNDGPALLFDLVEAGVLETTDDVLRTVLPGVWSGAEWPCGAADAETWATWFGDTGYTVDGAPAQRPSGPVRLYRGADAERARGMSWSPDLSTAQWFAQRPIWPEPGQVWVTLAPPVALLARIENTARPGEVEVVVDSCLLGEITAV